MIKLICIEVKKMFSKRLLYILMVIFLLVSNANIILPMLKSPEMKNKDEENTESFLEEYGGKITEQKYKFITEEYAQAEAYYLEHGGDETNEPGRFASTRLGDYIFLMPFAAQVEYSKKYVVKNQKMLEQAKKNIEIYEKRSDTYKKNENQLVLDLYSDKPIPVIGTADGWYYLGYNSHVLFILLLLVIFVSPIFSSEHENKMHPIIYSSIRGRGCVMAAKIITAVLFAVMISICFEMFNCGLHILHDGLVGFSEYIQNSETYQLCPFNITFGEYMILHMCIIALGAIGFSIMICLISALSKNTIVSIAVSSVIIVLLYGNIFSSIYLPEILGSGFDKMFREEFIQYVSFSKKYLLMGLLEPQNYFMEFQVVKVFDLPVLSIVFNIILSIVKCILLIFAAGIVYCRPQRLLKRRPYVDSV